MHFDFEKDNNTSREVEDRFEQLLNNTGHKTERCSNGDWDIKATKDGKSKTFEIKDDIYSSETGNVCIEYECRGKPSGMATTKADYWVQYFNDAYHIVETKELRARAKELAHRDVYGGDKGSATRMYLIIMEDFYKIVKSVLQ